MTCIVYAPNGDGCFLEIGTFTDLPSAIAACPQGGKIEQITEAGSITIYP